MHYIGIDLGGTNIAVGVVNEDLEIVVKGKMPTMRERSADEIVKDMGALCRELVAKAGLTFDDIAGVGIAAPGIIDPERGEVKYLKNIEMFHYPIVERLKAEIPVSRVFLENDANAAALAEAKVGAGRGFDDVVMITLGTGVGGGIVIGGKLYSGFNYAAAEIGHMGIEANGRPCKCGRRGCFEAYSSATGLITMTKEHMRAKTNTVMWDICGGDLEKVDGRTAFDAAKRGDAVGQAVVDEYIRYLAYGIVNVINIFQPQVLCIGGGVCGEGDYLLKPLRALIDREEYGAEENPERTQVKIAVLGNDAGIIGAAAIGV